MLQILDGQDPSDNMVSIRITFVFCAVLTLALGGCVRAQDEDQKKGESESDGVTAVTPELRADVKEIKPGTTFTVGVHFSIERPWHIYWKEPGDAGLPTKVSFVLPPGFSAGELQWPPHIEFLQPGNIKGYGYEGETFLKSSVTAPPVLEGREIALRAHVSWLACSDRCVPGKSDLQLNLPDAK